MALNEPSQSTPLLLQPNTQPYDGDVESLLSSHLSKSERALHSTPLGERLPYNDYTTIDWLHDLVKDSIRARSRAHQSQSIRGRLLRLWDAAQGWVAAFLIGTLTALVAFCVDVAVATVADWKEGYCEASPWTDRRTCCGGEEECEAWTSWAAGWSGGYAVYVGVALVFGLVAGGVTMTTRATLPAVDGREAEYGPISSGKMMYMAAGSGIPEIKTILSGFVIPHFLDLKVLLVKAVGATFAVATGMCLGKEGPFVHISTCVGYLVASCFPKYRDNQGKLREMLSVACSAGLSVAFGAPIGGVLFSYEVRRLAILRVTVCAHTG
jgi:chloride channel 3/4/5